MTQLSLIGIGTGNPDHLTGAARRAIASADLFLIPRKADKSDLADLRTQIIDTVRADAHVAPFDMPVRDDSVLVGLGPISDDQPTELRAELYRDLDDVTAYRFTMRRSDGEWTLAEAPEVVDPEGLVADP